jgi:two-component system phosphate regulon response regulator PhoB
MTEPSVSPAGSPAGPLILVADDDEAVRDLVCDMLSDAGFRTVTASDGEEVTAQAVQHHPALIILDVMMPHMDGYTTLTRLRGRAETRTIPVIVLTGQAEPVYRTLSAGVGAAAHLTKPFSARQLTETVRKALGAPA